MHPHKPISVALLCMDFRFWPKALPLLKEKFGDLDLIELAGGAKNLASPMEKEDKKAVLENIALSIKLHGAKRIILTNHADCGAYGGSAEFKCFGEEEEFHKKELAKAKAILRKKFPRTKIQTIFIIKEKNKIILKDE